MMIQTIENEMMLDVWMPIELQTQWGSEHGGEPRCDESDVLS